MRKLFGILFVAALAALVLAAPSSVSANPDTGLRYYGVNTRAADLTQLGADEINRAHYANGRWTVRALFDKRTADNAGGVTAAYANKLTEAYQAGITIMPIIAWSTGSSNPDDYWYRPASQAERDAFYNFAWNVMNTMHWAADGNGATQTNVVEIWNEPNCMVDGTPPGPGDCTFGGFSSLDDYRNSAYIPGCGGAYARDNNIKCVVGGLGFGTESTNGFNDAVNWVNTWESQGYAAGSSAYSVHAYGYTDQQTHTRLSTASQTAARALGEFNRVCTPSSDAVIVTETGRRTDVFSQSQQHAFLNDTNNNLGFRAAGIFNYLSIDQSASGSGSAGVLDVNNNPKLAFDLWSNLGRFGWQWMFSLNYDCT